MTHSVKLPPLETPRLVLTPATEADLDPLCALLWHPEVRRYLCDNIEFPREQIAGFLARSVVNWTHGIGHWTIRDRTGARLGFVELKFAPAEISSVLAGEVEPGIALAPEHWGRGYASEALQAAITYAFATLRLARLVGTVDEPNQDSHRMMTRAGFVRIGKAPGPAYPQILYRLERPA
jgi:[ribosomal protein S5]-alanine N-acetyltransferase